MVLDERPRESISKDSAASAGATFVKSTSTSEGATLVEEISDADNFDSVSFTSSIFSDGSDSFDAKNVTLPNGRLNIDKLMSWSLPSVNLSRVMERSACRSPGTRGKIQRLMNAQKSDTRPDHFTPTATIFTCRKKGKKTKSYLDSLNTLSERDSIKRMLENN